MSSSLRILGWTIRGLRCPDHTIDFTRDDDEPYGVSLIQMPNGTGKTTILSLLRAAISGAAINNAWSTYTVNQFKDRDSDPSTGSFEVRLLLSNRRVTILMLFDFDDDIITYKTSIGKGLRDGFHPPPEFRQFMNSNFVNYCIFDGELAEHLLDSNYADAQTIVESLFQLNTFRDIRQKITEYWDSITDKVDASEEKGLTRRRNRIIRLRALITERQASLNELQREVEELKNKKDKMNQKYEEEIGTFESIFEDLHEKQTMVEDFSKKVRDVSQDILERMRDPHVLSPDFSKAMLSLKDGLDRVKLPQSAAREFFLDLTNEEECICGREIDAHIAEEILERSQRYLAEDDMSLLNAIKSDIRGNINAEIDSDQNDLLDEVLQLRQCMDEEIRARNSLDQFKYETERLDPKIQEIRQEIIDLEREIQYLEAEKTKYTSPEAGQNDESTFGIEVLSERLSNAEEKLAEITQTLTIRNKCELLKSIVDNAHTMSRDEIANDVCEITNGRIKEVMPSNRISLDRIDRHLVLEGQQGGSAGETLSIAYAYLSTLFNRTDHQFPFVVDSPAGPIDLHIRPKIGRLIPSLTEQFIAFTISSERPGFVDELKQASSEELQFITLFRKHTGFEIETGNVPDKDMTLTTNGVLVEDEEFFDRFQLDEEEDT